MKTQPLFKFLLIVALLLTIIFVTAIQVLAQDDAPPDETVITNPLPADSPLYPLYENIIGLIGIGATLALTATALFKRVPGLKELPSQHVSTAMVLLIFVIYVGFYYTGTIEQYPAFIEGINTVGTGLLALLGTSIAAEFGYRGAKAASVPILGYSNHSETVVQDKQWHG